MDSEGIPRGKNCELTPKTGQSVTAATSLANSLSKRNRSECDDTTDTPEKKLKMSPSSTGTMTPASSSQNQSVTQAKSRYLAVQAYPTRPLVVRHL